MQETVARFICEYATDPEEIAECRRRFPPPEPPGVPRRPQVLSPTLEEPSGWLAAGVEILGEIGRVFTRGALERPITRTGGEGSIPPRTFPGLAVGSNAPAVPRTGGN